MQFANCAVACASHRLKQLATDPELKQAVGHEHVTGAAGVVPPHAHLLVVDADDSVAGHLPADPLLSVALGMSQLMPDRFIAGAEAALGREVAQRLVRPLRVVVGHPLIECLLGCLQGLEDLPGVELDSEGAVEALDLARGGRRAWLGEDVVDSVLAADAVEQHLHRGLREAAGEAPRAPARPACAPARRRFGGLPSRHVTGASRAPWLPQQARFDVGSEPAGATDYSGLPVRRLRSAPANGASSAERCPNPWPPRPPSDRRRLPPGPPCTSAQSRSSPSCAGA